LTNIGVCHCRGDAECKSKSKHGLTLDTPTLRALSIPSPACDNIASSLQHYVDMKSFYHVMIMQKKFMTYPN